MTTTDCDAKLQTYLNTFGIAASDQQRALLLKHLELVIEKNRVVNLTRIVDLEDAVIRHVVDSLLFLPAINSCVAGGSFSLLDMGTGAGFPGIPITLMTNCSSLLVDSVGKKVYAVNDFISELGLESRAQAQSVRVEELAKRRRSSFDIVTARAVAELGVLVEYAAPLLKQGGSLVVSKGKLSDAEYESGCKTAHIVGMKNVSRETYELPEETGHREILIFTRVGKSKVSLPRKTGMAKHHPLAQTRA